MSQARILAPSAPGLRSLLAGMAGYGAADAASGLVRLALAALYSRLLAPAEFGVLAIVYVSVTLVVTALPLGLPDVLMVRFRDGHAGKMREDKDRVFTLLLAACAVAGMAVAVGVRLVPGAAEWRAIAQWSCLWAATQVLWFVPQQSLRFVNKVWQYGVARVSQVVVLLGVLLWFVHAGQAGLRHIVLAETAGSVCSLVLVLALDSYVPRLRLPAAPAALLAPGLPFCLLALGVFVVDLSDRYVITALMGVEATGYYAAATRITVVGMLLAAAMHAMWQPHFYRRAAESPFDTAVVRRHTEGLIVVAAVLVGVAMVVLPLFFTLSMGGQTFMSATYRRSAVLVAPLMLQYFFRTVYYLTTPSIAFRGRTWRQVAMTACVAAANVLGNVVVIAAAGEQMVRGLVMVAVVTAVSYAGAMVYGMREMDRLYPGASPRAVVVALLGAVLAALCWVSV